ncbi:uncharacterized protein PgNI_07386 [Pyricularia grisea]|uniref:Uncharacterized protein n=1 Tax=Pyricularia grisea TaxID=148305 RepID=A0A6P8B362_PYRGI|nr:uncharacterized protein PgNI_07386 [Pyricularia grisea]TLD09306.1 hypothetical protein PgNI_07386 [Pyricularia grisea]
MVFSLHGGRLHSAQWINARPSFLLPSITLPASASSCGFCTLHSCLIQTLLRYLRYPSTEERNNHRKRDEKEKAHYETFQCPVNKETDSCVTDRCVTWRCFIPSPSQYRLAVVCFTLSFLQDANHLMHLLWSTYFFFFFNPTTVYYSTQRQVCSRYGLGKSELLPASCRVSAIQTHVFGVCTNQHFWDLNGNN